MTKSPKFKRIILNFKDHPNFDIESTEKILEKCNNKDVGRHLTKEDLYIYFINSINDKVISKIQESTLTDWDRLKQKYLLAANDGSFSGSFDDFVISKVKL